MTSRLILVLGGARSGKSRTTEQWAARHGGRVVYVATAAVTGDAEWNMRVARHRQSRPSHWLTVETTDPVAELNLIRNRYDVAIIDCLTLLLFDWLGGHREDDQLDDQFESEVSERAERLAKGLRALNRDLLVVSNEIGFGLVPPSRLGRFYRDALGRLNQVMAQYADQVYLTVAGLPLRLKPGSETGINPWT